MGTPKPYATPADFYDWTGETLPQTGGVSPADLRRAEIRVDEMLIGVVYAVDSSGHPTDPRVIRALMEATCAQAAWFDETGDTAGALAVLGGGAIGSVKLPTATTAAGGKGATIDLRYSSEAADILAAAGLSKRSVRYS